MIDERLQQALLLHQQGQLPQAQRLYEEILRIQPDHFGALQLLGIIAAQTRDYRRAVDLMNQSIGLFPNDAGCYFNRGLAHQGLKEWERAVASYDRAIALRPDYNEAWFNRGNALTELRQHTDAIASYDKAIELKTGYAEAWFNRANTLLDLKRLPDAIADYEHAIAIKPAFAEAWSNRAMALHGLRLWDTALASYDQAITIKPEYDEAWSNRGNTFLELKQWEVALASYDQAITINPEYAEAWHNRGNALRELKQFEEAAESFARALSLSPDNDNFLGAYLHLKMKICDWTSFDEYVNKMVTKIANHKSAFTPFHVITILNSISMQKQLALIHAEETYPSRSIPQEIIKRSRQDKILVGYYSADYHNHATMHLMAELFEKHDRSKFEIIAFSFGPDAQEDVMRERVVSAFDQFIDVRTKSDQEIAAMSRELEVDIAVDLKGFTVDARTDIFSYRAAPIQVNFMGYPGTMAAEYMDYLVADSILVPQQYQQFYTEKIVYLPDSYQVNDTKRQIADKIFTRKELGLPETGFVFCCFNNNYKITPDIFDCWMRILQRLEGSVLWLYMDNQQASANLRKEAVRRGVEADRLVFAGRMPLPEHLARHRSADLFLDTLPCNAHTTASDALWAGLPVLTRIGESFAGRVAASLLNAVHLPELITSSLEEYESLAIELATHPEKLNELKHKLEKNRLTTPLFDSDLFTRHIEAAYREMYERYHFDLPPDHIYVKPDRPVMRM